VKSGSIYVKTRPNDSRPINHILSDTFHQHNALFLRYLYVSLIISHMPFVYSVLERRIESSYFMRILH